MVALTGIEPAGCQSSAVQVGLSSCIFSSAQFDTILIKGVWIANVLPCRGDLVGPGAQFPAPGPLAKFTERMGTLQCCSHQRAGNSC